jgi:AraC-like DNA-binding protein
MRKEQRFTREGYLEENYHYFHLRDTAGQERDYHYHEFDKIVLLLAGRVDYAVESVTYALRPWDILLVKHHVIHKALIDKSVPYERIILYLDGGYYERLLPDAGLMNSFEQADRSGEYRLVPDEQQRAALERTLQAYEQAAGDGQFGAQTLCDSYILQLLVLIGRMNAVPRREEQRFDPKIRQTLSFINENLSRELSVDTLAERVYLSRYHFMRLFKAETGSTVHAYVRQKRLLYAARLIREGTNANQAAEAAGFSDYSTFHRAFRNSFGVSPGQLKK